MYFYKIEELAVCDQTHSLAGKFTVMPGVGIDTKETETKQGRGLQGVQTFMSQVGELQRHVVL